VLSLPVVLTVAVDAVPLPDALPICFVVEELEGDRAAGVRAEQATELGGVLEGGADGAGGGVLDGFDRGARGADFDRLIRAARDGIFVVGFGGVAGGPVVGACLGRRG